MSRKYQIIGIAAAIIGATGALMYDWFADNDFTIPDTRDIYTPENIGSQKFQDEYGACIKKTLDETVKPSLRQRMLIYMQRKYTQREQKPRTQPSEPSQ